LLTRVLATAVLSLTGLVACGADPPTPPDGVRHLYVTAGGSDRNPGTRAEPLRQVSAAAEAAGAGTVVHVGPGSYGPVRSTRSGTARAPVTFVSDTRWAARIVATDHDRAWTNTGSWVVVRGFEITGARYGGIVSTASHGRFLDNHVHHLRAPDCSRGGAGIELQTYTGTDNDTIGNLVTDVVAPGDCALVHGIYYQSPAGGRILDNTVRGTSGWGIHLWHNARGITIVGNTVSGNRKGGILVGGSLEEGDRPPGIAQDVVVTGNTVVDNGDWGIRELGRVGRNTYSGNVVHGNAVGSYDLRDR
jgi:parallel beta-helix repeat protein